MLPSGTFHIYAIGTQECERSIAKSAVITSKKKWESKISAALGDNYEMLRSHTLQAIHLAIYVRRELVSLVTELASDAVATGFAKTFGNKGGVGISFSIGSSSFLFVSSHLAAKQYNVARRNEDFHIIDANLKLGNKTNELAPENDDESALSVHKATPTSLWSGSANAGPNFSEDGTAQQTSEGDVDAEEGAPRETMRIYLVGVKCGAALYLTAYFGWAT